MSAQLAMLVQTQHQDLSDAQLCAIINEFVPFLVYGEEDLVTKALLNKKDSTKLLLSLKFNVLIRFLVRMHYLSAVDSTLSPPPSLPPSTFIKLQTDCLLFYSFNQSTPVDLLFCCARSMFSDFSIAAKSMPEHGRTIVGDCAHKLVTRFSSISNSFSLSVPDTVGNVEVENMRENKVTVKLNDDCLHVLRTKRSIVDSDLLVALDIDQQQNAMTLCQLVVQSASATNLFPQNLSLCKKIFAAKSVAAVDFLAACLQAYESPLSSSSTSLSLSARPPNTNTSMNSINVLWKEFSPKSKIVYFVCEVLNSSNFSDNNTSTALLLLMCSQERNSNNRIDRVLESSLTKVLKNSSDFLMTVANILQPYVHKHNHKHNHNHNHKHKPPQPVQNAIAASLSSFMLSTTPFPQSQTISPIFDSLVKIELHEIVMQVLVKVAVALLARERTLEIRKFGGRYLQPVVSLIVAYFLVEQNSNSNFAISTLLDCFYRSKLICLAVVVGHRCYASGMDRAGIFSWLKGRLMLPVNLNDFLFCDELLSCPALVGSEQRELVEFLLEILKRGGEGELVKLWRDKIALALALPSEMEIEIESNIGGGSDSESESEEQVCCKQFITDEIKAKERIDELLHIGGGGGDGKFLANLLDSLFYLRDFENWDLVGRAKLVSYLIYRRVEGFDRCSLSLHEFELEEKGKQIGCFQIEIALNSFFNRGKNCCRVIPDTMKVAEVLFDIACGCDGGGGGETTERS